MTRSVYVIGGAGTGKSTFTAQLLEGFEFGPLEDIFSARNSKNLVTLRGHRLPGDGLYLGCMREGNHPGTDGLDRACHQTGVGWLMVGDLPTWIIGEGATLAIESFITTLAETTELLLVRLHCSDEIQQARFQKRGTSQSPTFVKSKTTAAANLFEKMDVGDYCDLLNLDSGNDGDWNSAIRECRDWLSLGVI
jgi:hypothetical protein